MGWFSNPEKIDPTEVGNYFDQGGYVKDIGDMSKDIMDPNSAYSQGILDNLRSQTQDSLFAKGIVNRRNSAASGMLGQSGIFDEMNRQQQDSTYAQMTDQYNQIMGQNFDKGMGLLQSAAQFDLSKGEAMASAYGQNITNQNNYNAAMAGNLMNLGSSLGSAAIMASDKRVKENIKKVGRAKAKDGKMVNVYSFNFKGSKKTKVGVIAQEVKKSHPKAVLNKGKGTMKVNYGKLFG